ncbi:MAG: sensor histidine kinase [Planctomycetaceae bacterium]
MKNNDRRSLSLERFFAAAPIGLCSLDTQLRFAEINEWLAAVDGASVQEHLGRTIGEMVPDVAAKVELQLRRVMETGRPVIDGTVSAKTAADPQTERTFQHSFYPLTSDDGVVLGVGCVVQDVTEHKGIEETLRLRERELAHIDRLHTLGEMIAGIVHEIGQPLYAMTNYANACRRSLADMQSNPEKLAEWIAHIGDAARQAGSIIDRLRRFASRRKPQREPSRIDEVVNEALALFRPRSREGNVDIAVTIGPGIESLMVSIDRVAVQQVLMNLLRNAWESMADNAESDREIGVTVSRRADAVEVAVRDRGEGISDDDSNTLFNAFFTTRKSGMGMGLAISRALVEEHGGRIWWTPNPDRGTTFHFSIPLP